LLEIITADPEKIWDRKIMKKYYDPMLWGLIKNYEKKEEPRHWEAILWFLNSKPPSV